MTRDVDLLGFGNASVSVMEDVFREILSSEVEPDGIEFDIPGSTIESRIADAP